MNRLSIFRDRIDLDEYHGKYLEYIHETSLKDSFKSHFQAAFYAPVLFLKGVKNFEGTFDQILFHLENAYDKASNEKAQRGVLISMQWLLDFHIDVIETGIDISESRLRADWHVQIWESIQKIVKELVDFFVGEPNEILITAEVGKLFNEYYVYLTNKKTIKKYQKQFYSQLLHVYSKVLNSKIYSSDHKLIVNSFMRIRDKQQLFAHALNEKGPTITLNMLRQFNMPKDDLGQTLRFIVGNLDEQKMHVDDLKTIFRFVVEQGLINQEEIKRGLLEFYKRAYKPKSASISQPVTVSIIVAVFIYIWLFIQGVNVNKGVSDNFWTMTGKYILAIGGSLLSSLYLTCAFLGIAIGIAIVVRSVISNYRERKFKESTKGFEKELDSINR